MILRNQKTFSNDDIEDKYYTHKRASKKRDTLKYIIVLNVVIYSLYYI